eukprot:tig00021070_g17898.t1
MRISHIFASQIVGDRSGAFVEPVELEDDVRRLQITFRNDFLALLPGRCATRIAAPDFAGELPTRNGCGAPRFSGRTSRPAPGHRRRAGPPDLRGPTETGAGKRSSFLGTAAATGGSARLPVRVLTWAIHRPSAAPGAAAGEEPGPEISPGEPSGPPRSSAPSLFRA